ncbi:MAG TPA: DUF4399 domain-containing protein [Magnetospirillaceae bacterium]|nr:DUF4399 domain-containing protein [Magnetospirillaceae bacterium]
MFRLFSPFTVSGRFALMLAINLIASGGGSAQEMRERDHDHERPGPTLVSPANGSMVDHEFTVRIGFAGGGGPHGPSEGTGIVMGPPQPADGGPPPRPERDGPAEGTGLTPGGGFQRRPHFVLLVDSPALDSGSAFKPDAQHIAFPAGIPQMTVSLPPGQHHLLLQTLDHDGSISMRHPPETITVVVKG